VDLPTEGSCNCQKTAFISESQGVEFPLRRLAASSVLLTSDIAMHGARKESRICEDAARK
jgi:hypothetical protein